MYSKTPPLKDLCYNYNLLSHNASNEQKCSCGLRLRDGATCIQLSGWRNTAPAKGGNHLTFPLKATTPTNNDDHLLLQKPVFLGLTARCWPFVHAKCSTLLHVSLVSDKWYNQGGFSAISICPGILKRPGVIRHYFQRLRTSSTRNYTRTCPLPRCATSFRPLMSGPALKKTGRWVTDRQAGIRDPCRISTQRRGF